jgi:hypothetical protein
MKKVLSPLMIMSFCLISMVTFSQQTKPDPEARAKRLSEKMKTELSLSESQYSKVYDINLKYAEKMKDLRGAEGDKHEKMTSVRDLNKNKNEELKAVLSEEQMSKYVAMRKEMKNKARDRRK